MKFGYEGRLIVLISGQQEDGTWVCEYTILEVAHAHSINTKGFPKGTFLTQDGAEGAALEAARTEIDERRPIGGAINGSHV